MSTAEQKLQLTWEEAVAWYRRQPDNDAAIEANYFDTDVMAAANRFAASEEFAATFELVPKAAKTVLDLGAGRGIASFAFASNHFNVTALEPDGSDDIGAGAIRKLAREGGLDITVVEEFGEQLPFESESFDVVYARQVLHHARDLRKLCGEVARVLKPNGIFIAIREHVLKSQNDLAAFLTSHPLHHLYGGEYAYTLEEYLSAMEAGGIEIKKIIKPFDSVINFFPQSESEMLEKAFRAKMQSLGLTRGAGVLWKVAKLFVENSRALRASCVETLNETGYHAGITYSFVGTKSVRADAQKRQ
ncbi:MAG: methyltransferase domain-containing protein [Rhizobacter sp.]|nr:methyltransferase domain-containing protein [Chlorobiales bacterium]